MSSERDTALYFEQLLAQGVNPKLAANWLIGEAAGYLNREGLGSACVAEKLTSVGVGSATGSPTRWYDFRQIAKEVFAACAKPVKVVLMKLLPPKG